MSNVFGCWFWKKKNKGIQQPTQYDENPGVVYDLYAESKFEDTFITKNHRRSSNSLNNNPLYLDRLLGLNHGRRMRSYPTSPVRRTPEDKGYRSDQRSKRVDTPYKQEFANVFVASVPDNSAHFKSKEPFPYQIPDTTLPRRSTLCYGVKLEHDPKLDTHEITRQSAEKPMEDYAMPSTSTFKKSHELREQERYNTGRHVTLDIPVSDDENLPLHEGNVGRVRTTIVRFRPHSSGSFSQPASVKVMPVRADQIEHPPDNMNVHQIPLKPTKQCPMLMTVDGRMLQPVEQNKVRRVSLSSEKEARSARSSVVGPEREGEDVSGFPTQPIGYAAPMMHRRSSVGRPSISRSSLSRENKATRRSSMAESNENEPFPFNQQETTPTVYAVPVVTRGRTRSVLQQSVKNLTSRRLSDQPTVNRKNIRCSKDADVQRQSLDPLKISKDEVMWVEPRRLSGQRTSTSKSPQVYIVQQQGSPKKRLSYPGRRRQISYDYKEDDYFSSDSIDDNKRKTRESVQKRPYNQQHAVYAAQMPSAILPDTSDEKGKDPPFKKKGKTKECSPRKDFCGLSCETAEDTKFQTFHPLSVISSSQQTDFKDDEMDLLCYPSEEFLKSTALTSESGSKLRWRIIIKRGDDK